MNTPNNAAALLPCPFCGSAGHNEYMPAFARWSVACSNWECEIGPVGNSSATEAGAAEIWNKRATLAQPDALTSQPSGGEEFERGYVKGYRAALGAAAAECRRIGEALDYAGNSYVRYEDAIKCAVAVSGLSPPSITEEPATAPIAWRAEFDDGWTEYADENGDGQDEWAGWANPPVRIVPLYTHPSADAPGVAVDEARLLDALNEAAEGDDGRALIWQGFKTEAERLQVMRTALTAALAPKPEGGHAD